jgi:hypothetical protein
MEQRDRRILHTTSIINSVYQYNKTEHLLLLIGQLRLKLQLEEKVNKTVMNSNY